MKLPRRTFLHLAVTLPAAPRFVWAQAYPLRPVRLVVQIPAGGSPDIVARVLAQWLSERLSQPFVVENRVGGTGIVATESVIRAAADGYSLLLAMSANAINASLYDNLRFNFRREIEPVASIATVPLLMVVHPSIPARTVSEFLAHAKANAGKYNMASSGNGSLLHVAGELFKMMADAELFHVPYRGEAPALSDLVSGHVQVLFCPLPASLDLVRTGKLRALAVTSATRQGLLPDVPAMTEFLPGYEASGWYGIVAPKGTPSEIVGTLNKAINDALADAKTKERLAELGCIVFSGSPANFGMFIADETNKWAKVIRFAGIKLTGVN